jgi:hypothetical protein
MFGGLKRTIGRSGVVVWLPEPEQATKAHFEKKVREVTVERWPFFKDAVRKSVDNPKPGLKPWLMVRNRIFSPNELASARASFIYGPDDAWGPSPKVAAGAARLETDV